MCLLRWSFFFFFSLLYLISCGAAFGNGLTASGLNVFRVDFIRTSNSSVFTSSVLDVLGGEVNKVVSASHGSGDTVVSSLSVTKAGAKSESTNVLGFSG